MVIISFSVSHCEWFNTFFNTNECNDVNLMNSYPGSYPIGDSKRLLCSLEKQNCVCAVTKLLLAKTLLPKSAGLNKRTVVRRSAQVQFHFRDDQQRTFEVSNISYTKGEIICTLKYFSTLFRTQTTGNKKDTTHHSSPCRVRSTTF